MDQRPRACCNVLSVFGPVVGVAGALLASLIQGGHPMTGLKVGVMTLGVFLALGFVSAGIALVRSERLWGLTALGMALNVPFVPILVMAPWDWPF